jgi:pantoate--beta-alanine ligase
VDAGEGGAASIAAFIGHRPQDTLGLSPMSARIVRTVAELRTACERARRAGERVALVPTMGALHEGHLALVRQAQQVSRYVVVSIFVNRTQFAPGEDFARYPRDFESDVQKLEAVGDSVVFAPEHHELYDADEQTRVHVGALSEPLCGRFRPGHFDGVSTVVAKLFGIVAPCQAIFGRKDFQQLLVIRRMARDLLLPVEVHGHSIVREADGLAMSSRNRYLAPGERARALAIVRGLDAAARRFEAGERRVAELERVVSALLEPVATSTDYVEIRDAETLASVGPAVEGRALLAVACYIGTTRLIDNVVLGEDPPPLHVLR